MDFTPKIYCRLLQTFKSAGYSFLRYENYCCLRQSGKALPKRFVILRHDVDNKVANSLKTAEMEADLGIKTTYYFRINKQSNNPDIIGRIVALGHEIGYHYEDMCICDGDVEKAAVHFRQQLVYLRQFYPVKTICMHGSPRSKHDPKNLWKTIDYHDYELIGEPYFDTDFSDVFYLTDTGRCWDGSRYSIRDKVQSTFNLHYHSTQNIIDALQQGVFPQRTLITTHPQRWTDNKLQWFNEFVKQKIKNQIKRVIAK